MGRAVKEFSRHGSWSYCPDCTIEDGVTALLERSDDEESAYCKRCGRTYRSSSLVLKDYDLRDIFLGTLKRLAPDVLQEVFDENMEAKVLNMLENEDAAAEQEEEQ